MAHPEFKTEPTVNQGSGKMSGMPRGGGGVGRDIHGEPIATSGMQRRGRGRPSTRGRDIQGEMVPRNPGTRAGR